MKNKQKPMQNKETNKKDNGKKRRKHQEKAYLQISISYWVKEIKKREWEENKHN